LALSPLVWAQSPPAGDAGSPPSSAAQAVPQHSFAPLVKRVLPAVVNISVTEKAGTDAMSEQTPEGFRGAPFDDFLRRFFEDRRGEGQDRRGEGQLIPRAVRGNP